MKRINTIYRISALTALLLILSTAGCSRKTELKDYNVVLIVIDTLRSDHLPFYGYAKDTAPFLNELSQKSMVFENVFSASSWTSPGTASIFTSLYPYQHGVLMGLLAIRNAQTIDPTVEINRIPEQVTTIPEVLKEAGYKTYGISDNLNIDARQGFAQGFDQLLTFNYSQAPKVNEIVKRWKTKMTANGKYFLYIQYMEPHAPYHPRAPWFQQHEDHVKTRISAYDSEISFCDQHIRELYEYFQWEKDTLLIITSDHGEGLWDHGHMGHGKTLYREEIQVPLIIQYPGATRAGRISCNVGTIDILPTIREIIGLPKAPSDEGLSLAGLMEKRVTDLGKRDLYSYLWIKARETTEWRSTVYKSWHFINKLSTFKKLYNLILDKKEKSNRIEPGRSIAAILESRFNEFMKLSKKYKQQSSKVTLDKEKMKQLKSLGYIE